MMLELPVSYLRISEASYKRLNNRGSKVWDLKLPILLEDYSKATRKA